MGAALQPETRTAGTPAVADLTLLDLVQAVADVTSDEREIIATVLYMLNSGQVRLCGNFAGAPLEVFDAALSD